MPVKLLHPHKSITATRKSSFFFITKVVCTEGDYGWAVVQPGELQWEEAREHRQGGRDISAICNTSHGRWTYHKARREVAITHNVVCAMFPVLSAGQPAQRPGSWTETAWLGVMKLPGSQVHPPFCIAVSEQSRCQTQWEKPERMLKMLLGALVFLEKIWNEMRLLVVEVVVILQCIKTRQDSWIQFGEYWSLLLPPPHFPHSLLVPTPPPTCSAWSHVKVIPPYCLLMVKIQQSGFHLPWDEKLMSSNITLVMGQ